jgi:hypothetical protein
MAQSKVFSQYLFKYRQITWEMPFPFGRKRKLAQRRTRTYITETEAQRYMLPQKLLIFAL